MSGPGHFISVQRRSVRLQVRCSRVLNRSRYRGSITARAGVLYDVLRDKHMCILVAPFLLSPMVEDMDTTPAHCEALALISFSVPNRSGRFWDGVCGSHWVVLS